MDNKTKKVFHPGYYLKDYLEEMCMTQDEFSKRLGISGKQLSMILDGKSSITIETAVKLSYLIGTSPEVWINLQAKYGAYLLELEMIEDLKKEKEIFKMIDKSFLQKLKIINIEDSTEVSIMKLRRALPVSNLTLLQTEDLCSLNRTAVNGEFKLENVICRNVWISLALQEAKQMTSSKFDEKKLKSSLMEFRAMTLKQPDEFYPEILQKLLECGVRFVLLPSLKNSNTSGAVKWLDSETVMMALNTRGATNDKFWFNFFHEIKHVLQKVKRKTILDDSNGELEVEANKFAEEILINKKDYEELITKTINQNNIEQFADKIKIHPGIVIGRLQKDQYLPYNKFNSLKESYEVIV